MKSGIFRTMLYAFIFISLGLGTVFAANVTTSLLTTSLTANRTLISAGQGVSFTNNTIGGTGSNNYSYSVFPNFNFTENGNVFNFSAPGNYTVTLNVTDFTLENANAIANITVTPVLTANLTANRTVILADNSISFTNSTAGGTGNESYSYSVSPTNGFTENANIFNFTSTGNYTVTLLVSDLSGENANATANVIVEPPLSTLLNANKTLIGANQLVSFTNTTLGGLGNDVYSYSISPSNGFTENANIFNFTTAGNYTVTLNVSDTANEIANSVVTVNVTAPLAVSLNGSRTILTTQSVTFTNITSGGTGNNIYTYAISPNFGFTPNPCGNSCTFALAGIYTVTLNVKDLSGESVNSTASITVNQPSTTTTAPPSGGGGSSSGGGGGGGGGSNFLPTILSATTQTSQCSTIYNFTQHNAETILVLNRTFKITENYITPTSAGITIGNNTYELLVNQSDALTGQNGTNYTIELTGLSYLPIIDTVTIALCGSINTPTIVTPNQTSPVVHSVIFFISKNNSDDFNVSSLGVNLKLTTGSKAGTASEAYVSAYNTTNTGNLGYVLINAFNISVKSPVNITAYVTINYPCNVSASSLHAFLLQNNTWTEVNSTVDANSCKISFAIPADPIVGIFSGNSPATSTSAPSTTTVNQKVLAAPSTATQQSGQPNVANIVYGIVGITIVVALMVEVYNRNNRSKGTKHYSTSQRPGS